MRRKTGKKMVFLGIGAAAATFVAGLLGMAGTVPRDDVVNHLWYPVFLAGMVFCAVVTIYWFDPTPS